MKHRSRAGLEEGSGVVVSAQLPRGQPGCRHTGPWMQEWSWRSWAPWGEKQHDAAGARLGKGVPLPGHSEAEEAKMGPHG